MASFGRLPDQVDTAPLARTFVQVLEMDGAASVKIFGIGNATLNQWGQEIVGFPEERRTSLLIDTLECLLDQF